MIQEKTQIENIHIALPFARSGDGQLKPGEATICACEISAAAKAEELGKLYAGAVAFTRSIDIEIGTTKPAHVLQRIGELPKLDYLLGSAR